MKIINDIFTWGVSTGAFAAAIAFVIATWKGILPKLQASARTQQQKDLIQAINGAVTKYATYSGLSKADRRKAVISDIATYVESRGLSWVTPELISGLAEAAYQEYKKSGKDIAPVADTPVAHNDSANTPNAIINADTPVTPNINANPINADGANEVNSLVNGEEAK